MDQSIRNKLRNVVTQCRKLLEEAVSQVLQGQFGIHASGKKDEVHVEDEGRMKNLSDEDKGYRRDIIAHLEHIQALGYKAKDALAQLVREIAFTHLNRLCAYKMMEAREVWVGGQRFREAVSRGMKSQGFQFYLADHGDDKKLFDAGHQDVAYRHFLGWLGALLSEEIGVLFSPTDPANRLFPPQRVLDDVLALLNSDDLNDIWAEDETIGWVYQYFTPKELRDQVRKESAAPRNSYELAFRNQFFTPRYVVEFLTDNTLGRIWYEMRKGDTKLKDQCRYMVRRPSEVFLVEGQSPPEPPQNQEELLQDELLKQPVHIPHRAKKDPRELRILDPACGSGHFLLYCFDLLLTIYEEAYADPDLGPKLKEDYPTLEALRRDVPRLILAHNLHGIDIDLRASQIAALALWLRCQREYRAMGLKQDRPKITKSNIVCAEPMPGEDEMLKEFVADLQPKVLGHLVEVVFDKMKLAGEAGSLLKIEEELRDAIADVKKKWVAETEQATDRKGQPLLFTVAEMDRLSKKTPQPQLFDFSEITDEQFWNEAENQVLAALRTYSAHATNGGRLKRQLFADDAAQGFAFIDLCQKRFDAVAMNPPFGDPSKKSKPIIDKLYPRTKQDLYAAFVEVAISRLQRGGVLGVISSRTGFFLSSFHKWREEIVLTNARPTVFADLGYGVLDTAMVETAAYCIEARSGTIETPFLRLLQTEDKPRTLLLLTDSIGNGDAPADCFVVNPSTFEQVPTSPFAYWVSDRVRRKFRDLPPFQSDGRLVKQGLVTGNDFRFVRLWTEVQSGSLLTGRHDDPPSAFRSRTREGKGWVLFAKGGEYSPFCLDVQLCVRWHNDGEEIRSYSDSSDGSISSRYRGADHYFLPGITWPARPHKRGGFSSIPSGCIYSHTGTMLFLPRKQHWAICALLNSDAYIGLLHLLMPRGSSGGQTLKYEIGYVSSVPIPALDSASTGELAQLGQQAYLLSVEKYRFDELSHFFERPILAKQEVVSIQDSLEDAERRQEAVSRKLQVLITRINAIAFHLYGLEERDRITLTESFVQAPASDAEEQHVEEDDDEGSVHVAASKPHHVSALISYCFGCIVGRWNNVVVGAKHASGTPDPFSPFADHSPGMLQADEEHGAKAAIRLTSDGIVPDDPDHIDDIVRRVREVLELIWKDRAEAIEKEACEILGVKELRDYFRKPGKGGFWDDHVSRYSKSRRKAPIYWLLQSSKKNYALWLYYHRLDKDMLFKARQNYVEPKIRLEQSRLDSLRSQKTALGADAKGAKKFDKDIERQEALLGELKDFADKLERAAKLNFGNPEKLNSEVVYDPDLNDGVVLTIAPLWELVPWKDAKKYWEELLEGKHEWSSMGKLLRKKGLVT